MIDNSSVAEPLLHKAVAVGRQEGPGCLVVRMCRWLLKGPMLQRDIVVVGDISEKPLVKARIPITCEILQREELESFANVDFFQRPLAVLESRLNEGQICFIAKNGGQIVAGWWVEFGIARSTGLLGRELPLAEDEVFGHSAFTVPEYRGNIIAPALYSFGSDWLAQAGYRRVVGLVAMNNNANLSALVKNGWHPIGSIGYLEMLGWRWRWYFCSASSLSE